MTRRLFPSPEIMLEATRPIIPFELCEAIDDIDDTEFGLYCMRENDSSRVDLAGVNQLPVVVIDFSLTRMN